MKTLHIAQNTPADPAKKSSYDKPKDWYEKSAWQVQEVVCGIDEVGRGCLAGPVVTAAVILPPGTTNPLLKDSKCMKKSDRLKAYAWITQHSWYALGAVHHRTVDQKNIWYATLHAMHKAAIHLMAITPKEPSAFLVDAMPLSLAGSAYDHIPVHHFIKGEQKSSSIAAASIVAKVWRDHLITRMAALFPGYALAEHKGYATKKHTDALKAHTPSLIHRISFLKKIYSPQKAQKKVYQKEKDSRLC